MRCVVFFHANKLIKHLFFVLVYLHLAYFVLCVSILSYQVMRFCKWKDFNSFLEIWPSLLLFPLAIANALLYSLICPVMLFAHLHYHCRVQTAGYLIMYFSRVILLP